MMPGGTTSTKQRWQRPGRRDPKRKGRSGIPDGGGMVEATISHLEQSKFNKGMILYPTLQRSTDDERVPSSGMMVGTPHPALRRRATTIAVPSPQYTLSPSLGHGGVYDQDLPGYAPRTPPSTPDSVEPPSTFTSDQTPNGTIGAQAVVIPSPPSTRRLVTLAYGQERLPKSSRPLYDKGTTPPPSSSSSSAHKTLCHHHDHRFQPLFYYERIGDPRLRAFRVKLPAYLMQNGGRLLDDIMDRAERFATQRLSSGWNTDLYSLTKCDVACRDIPGMVERIKPVYDFVCHAMTVLYGCSRVLVDKNQPHILKYSAQDGHTGGGFEWEKEVIVAGVLFLISFIIFIFSCSGTPS